MRIPWLAVLAATLSACSPDGESGKPASPGGGALSPGGGAQAAATLESLMPSAPAGWKLEGAAVGETVTGAGKRAVATYVPADDAARASNVTRIEIHYAVLAAEAAEEKFNDLRKHDAAGFMFMSEGEVAGRKTSETPEFMKGRHLVAMRPVKTVIVDLLAFGAEKEPWDAPKKAVAAAFVERIDFGKIEAVK
jgi:hypothetical protein